ncbi:MAG TPA: porin family protein [Bacteroidales bacterium]|nr:porin family protein [Bacteroidales bacterium]
MNTQAQKPKVLNYSTHDDKAIHFGFCLGLNSMDFIIQNSFSSFQKDSLRADIGKPVPGFHIQIVSNYRLGEYFDLRFLPGISFGQRDINFFKNNVLVNEKHKLESNYLEFPILLKYKAKRLNNVRPYIVTGPNLRVDLAKTFSEDDEIYMDLKRFDIYHEVGVGMDFYLPYFKLGVEIKYSYGFFNMLERRNTTHPEYQNAIDKLNSSIFLFSLHFE